MARKQQSRPAKKRAAAKGGAKNQQKQQVKAKRSGASVRKVQAVDRVQLFVDEYLIDFNGRQAAIRAGYGPERARQTASELLAQPEVAARIDEALQRRQEANAIDAALVLTRLRAIGTADPRELIEVHRVCCRYCWGKDHLFQRTPREMREARLQWEADVAKVRAEAKAEGRDEPMIAPFDEAGGVGFNPYNDPNPACPECFGEGDTRVVAKDTRDLSPAARLLYAGAKQTQHGLEVRMHDQTGALRDLGKHLGLFRDKVELTGKDGAPIRHQTVGGILAELDADGADTGTGGST